MTGRPDIVDRLRGCRWCRPDGTYGDTYDLVGVEAERLDAADEVEFLRKVVATTARTGGHPMTAATIAALAVALSAWILAAYGWQAVPILAAVALLGALAVAALAVLILAGQAFRAWLDAHKNNR